MRLLLDRYYGRGRYTLDAARDAKRAPLADLRVYAADALARAGRRADAELLLTDELAEFPANVRARCATCHRDSEAS